MNQVDYKKVILITAAKIFFMMLTFFAINNWTQIQQSYQGSVAPLSVWLAHAYTYSNIIFIVLLSVVFFFNTLKHHKGLAEKRSKYMDI